MTLSIQPKQRQTRGYDQFEVVAEGLGRYMIEVSLPQGYVANGQQYPVTLTTDGNHLFDLTQTLVHGDLAKMVGVLPPSIVVGVGYPADEGMASFYARRNFDFFGPWDMSDSVGEFLQGIFGSMKSAEGKHDMVMLAGGVGRFIGFLRDELLPSLTKHYPIDPMARHTLIGDSSGGHFVLRALYEPKSPFSRYVCISPAFGCAAGTIQAAEAAYTATHDDLDADLFICCGRQEIGDDRRYALAHAGSGVTWIAEQFAVRNWPSARIDWEIMNNEDHSFIMPRTIAAGLRSVHRVRPGVHTEELKKAFEAMMEDFSQSRRSPRAGDEAESMEVP